MKRRNIIKIISTGFISFYCLFFAAGSVLAKIEVVIYSDNNYPPYSYEEEKEAKGIYTEILKTAFSRMDGYNVQIKPIPWKRGLNYLKTGTGLALYPPYHRKKERPYIWPYSIPILDERVVVFCRDDIFEKSLRPNWPEDYYGLTIGNNLGFELGGDKFWQAVKEGKIKLDEVRGNRLNLLKLIARRIDCYMNDRLSIIIELKRLKATGEYEGLKNATIIEGATITTEQGFLGFTATDKGKFHYKKDFVKKFNIEIYNMRKNGELQDILDRYTK